MSFARYFRWTCDACGAQVERGPYGLPSGWTYCKPRRDDPLAPLEHRCEACSKDEPHSSIRQA